ncbi:MAG: DNA-directed RNA polymerase subunit omega [Lachnospiraceae bacterium]|nr:DNA-directed RNA polymerase subunit omega [Lachnospiraceae bacterium]
MIHPSYNELYEAINKDRDHDDPLLSSRYSVCTATARRAEQIIRGQETFASPKCDKPLSIAIEEIYTGKVKVLSEEEALAMKEAEEE